MDKLTTNLQRVAVYMDDILVIGATAAENLQNLHAILKTSLLLGEVLLAQLSIEHLGHSLSQHRVGKGHKVNVPSHFALFLGGTYSFTASFFLNLATITVHFIWNSLGLESRTSCSLPKVKEPSV